MPPKEVGCDRDGSYKLNEHGPSSGLWNTILEFLDENERKSRWDTALWTFSTPNAVGALVGGSDESRILQRV